jgi:hypothetical protein
MAMEKGKAELLTTSSRELSKKNLTAVTKNILKEGNKLSIYTGSLTLEVLLRQVDRLRKVFKGLDNDWLEVLRERLKANNFTDQRLIDAVDNLFDKFKFGHTPNIAEIIDFDRTIELTSYKQILDMLKADEKAFTNYTVVDIDGQPRYILKEYQVKYNLKLFKFEQKENKNKLYPELSDEERLETAKIMRELIEKMNVTELRKKKKVGPPKFVNKNGRDYQKAKQQFQEALISEKMQSINSNLG